MDPTSEHFKDAFVACSAWSRTQENRVVKNLDLSFSISTSNKPPLSPRELVKQVDRELSLLCSILQACVRRNNRIEEIHVTLGDYLQAYPEGLKLLSSALLVSGIKNIFLRSSESAVFSKDYWYPDRPASVTLALSTEYLNDIHRVIPCIAPMKLTCLSIDYLGTTIDMSGSVYSWIDVYLPSLTELTISPRAISVDGLHKFLLRHHRIDSLTVEDYRNHATPPIEFDSVASNLSHCPAVVRMSTNWAWAFFRRFRSTVQLDLDELCLLGGGPSSRDKVSDMEACVRSIWRVGKVTFEDDNRKGLGFSVPFVLQGCRTTSHLIVAPGNINIMEDLSPLKAAVSHYSLRTTLC